jgi:hypothetical protein
MPGATAWSRASAHPGTLLRGRAHSRHRAPGPPGISRPVRACLEDARMPGNSLEAPGPALGSRMRPSPGRPDVKVLGEDFAILADVKVGLGMTSYIPPRAIFAQDPSGGLGFRVGPL